MVEFFNGQRYVLGEYVVMPNHVHALVRPLANHDLDRILHSWKSFSANQISKRTVRAVPCGIGNRLITLSEVPVS